MPVTRSAPATPTRVRSVGGVSDTTRKVAAELIGSAMLAATVVGSGIAAQTLSPDDIGLQLLENALITGAVLVALILALGPVSAAFNPVVTLAERVLGAISTAQAALFITAQVVGCSLGVIVANLMFELDPIDFSTTERAGAGLWLGEVVATFGLLVVIFGVVRSGRTSHVAYAVGAYITAAYWFTSSTSFANPAITLSRTLSDTFAGIEPASAPVFVLMQLLGGALGVTAVLLLYPRAQQLADDLTRLDDDQQPITGDPR
jgi:glycerol uptake facilitator-like aquaporin